MNCVEKCHLWGKKMNHVKDYTESAINDSCKNKITLNK